MTRKDYVLLATALRNARPGFYHDVTQASPAQTVWLASAYSVADALTKDNPRFDSDRFLTACGVNEDGAR